MLQKATFGALQWMKYFGDVEEEPPLPPDIGQILKSPCPFWKGKLVVQTHKLILIPKTLNGELLTLETLGRYAYNPKEGHSSRLKYYDDLEPIYKDLSIKETQWILITKTILPETKDKTYKAQKAFINKQAKKSHCTYQAPSLLEMVTAIFVEYVRAHSS